MPTRKPSDDPSTLSQTASAVRFEGATKRYGDSPIPAVDKLTLEAPAGEICVLVGPSGCGKTTAMRLVNRTVELTEGDVLVGDRSVRDRDAAELRKEIGYVIQQIGLFPHRTIGENVATVPHLLGKPKDEIEDRVTELLDRYPAELSGGQQQRVGVARALAADPPVLLMDEPFGALDPITRASIRLRSHPISRGTVATLAATFWCGKRPVCWMT